MDSRESIDGQATGSSENRIFVRSRWSSGRASRLDSSDARTNPARVDQIYNFFNLCIYLELI